MSKLQLRGSVTLVGWLLLLSTTLRAAPPNVTERTALDDYIAKKDPTYSWRLAEKREEKDRTIFAIELTSQTWRNAEEVDRPVWKHWLTVVRPKEVKST